MELFDKNAIYNIVVKLYNVVVRTLNAADISPDAQKQPEGQGVSGMFKPDASVPAQPSSNTTQEFLPLVSERVLPSGP